jgi:hypothetical protein
MLALRYWKKALSAKVIIHAGGVGESAGPGGSEKLLMLNI